MMLKGVVRRAEKGDVILDLVCLQWINNGGDDKSRQKAMFVAYSSAQHRSRAYKPCFPQTLMQGDYTLHFTEIPEKTFKMLYNVPDCKEFLVHNNKMFCLTSRNTLAVPSEDEEYEFYGDIVRMTIHGHHIYLIFASSRILAFDVVSREVTANFSGINSRIKMVKVVKSGMYFLCDDGSIYKSLFEDLRHVKQDLEVLRRRNHIVLTFGVDEDAIFLATSIGDIYRNSVLVLRIFGTVKLMVPCNRHLYILTAEDLLIKYDLEESKVIFRLEMGKTSVIGDSCMMFDSTILDLLDEVYTRVPRDVRSIFRMDEILHIQTLSGIWGM